MLLRGNLFHLAMNMLAMLSFGPFLERLMGSTRYLVAEPGEAGPGLHFTQKPKLTRLPSGREVVFAAMAPNDTNDVRFLWQWWIFQDRRWVMVLGNALNTTKPERRDQMERVADSVVTTALQ